MAVTWKNSSATRRSPDTALLLTHVLRSSAFSYTSVAHAKSHGPRSRWRIYMHPGICFYGQSRRNKWRNIDAFWMVIFYRETTLELHKSFSRFIYIVGFLVIFTVIINFPRRTNCIARVSYTGSGKCLNTYLENFYVYASCVTRILKFHRHCNETRHVTIILANFETNLKMYIHATRYLLQMCY